MVDGVVEEDPEGQADDEADGQGGVTHELDPTFQFWTWIWNVFVFCINQWFWTLFIICTYLLHSVITSSVVNKENSVITIRFLGQIGYISTQTKMAGPELFVITKFDCIQLLVKVS